MNILFLHNNFPGQWKHLAPHFAKQGHTVVAIGERRATNPTLPGVRLVTYAKPKGATDSTHHYIRGFEAAVRRGQEVTRTCFKLKGEGFAPDVIYVHPGWGEGLYLKDVWPNAYVLSYFEFFYHSRGVDVGFDPEYPSSADDLLRVRTKNATLMLSLEFSDWGLSPTRWQWSLHPAAYRDRISVIHDGVDTETVRPDPRAVLSVPDRGLRLTRQDTVLTFVVRNLEPYRGFHVFMRALPEIQRRNPNAQIVIVGSDGVSYGRKAGADKTYRQALMEEVGAGLDRSRIHFLGWVPYDTFLKVLQVSTAHVYMTYPFVLSWSCLEAMAAGCCVVASATAPVTEAVEDGRTGLLFDFFDQTALVEQVTRALAGGPEIDGIRTAARTSIQQRYDLATVCLPQHDALFQRTVTHLTGRRAAE